MMGSLVRIAALGIVTLGVVSSVLAQNCRWEDRFPHPTRRIGESMAYDDARGVSVLFGGQITAGSVNSGETWVWDGLDWTQVSVSGPSPRASHKMVYDGDREVVVLFGGVTRAGYLGDTWEWDGKSWQQRASTGPTKRRFHAMAYDSARGVTVMYGGVGGNGSRELFDDTWVWDGQTWNQVSHAGPALDYGVEMVFDSNRGVAVLHGYSPASGETQTWEWDGLDWTQVGAGVPGVRLYQELAYDAARQLVVLSFGSSLWEYDGAVWTEQATNSSLSGGSATFAFAYDTQRDVTVLWASLDPWRTGEWDGVAWSYPLRTRPPAMNFPAMVYDASESEAIVVGSDFTWIPVETWAWDGAEWDLRTTGGPSPRMEHAMAYDSVRGVTTLFGGRDATGVSGETWEFDGQTWALVSSVGPSSRKDVSMAFDATRNVTYLHGGNAPLFNASQEVWEWNGVAWTQHQTFPDVWISRSAMAFDTRRNVLVLAGNTYSRRSMFDTWEFDGTGWAFRSTMPPIQRGSMVFDEDRGETVYFVDDDAWVWNGSDWVLSPSRGGVPIGSVRLRRAAAYDTARDVMMLLTRETPVTSIWEYSCDCYADCDGSGTLDIFDVLCYQWAFLRGDPHACNCDTSTGDNTCDIFDFLCFQSAFVGGCP